MGAIVPQLVIRPRQVESSILALIFFVRNQSASSTFKYQPKDLFFRLVILKQFLESEMF